MNLWDRVKFLFTGEMMIDGKQIGTKIPNWQSGVPQYPQDDYRSYANNGYSKNELVYACVQEVASSVPDAILMVYHEETDEKETQHPLRNIFKNPNPWQTEYDLWEITVIYLLLAGNAYWEKVRDRTGRVVELVPLQPERVRVVPSSETFIGGYIYEVDGIQYPLEKDDVIQFRMPNPNPDEQFIGMPPIRAALRAIATDNEATDFTKTILQNYAMPAVVITTQAQIDDELAARLTRKWKQKFGGRGQGEPAFLQEGMTINAVGLSLRDLEFPDLRNISETRICAVFGVPPILVGAQAGMERSTYSNYEEARRSFWQETIMPLLQKLTQRINKDLMPEFNELTSEQYYAGFDTDEVSALASLFNEQWDRTMAALEKGLLTRNEARTRVGYDEVEGGDIFLQSTNIIGVPENQQPPATPPAQPMGTTNMDPNRNPLRLVQAAKKKVPKAGIT